MVKSGVGETGVSPPSGGNFGAGLGESFSLDLNSGQGSYSVPVELPEGRAGFAPKLKLEYVHGADHSPFGLGWRLPLRSIESRQDFGVPKPGGRRRFLDGEVEIVPGDDNEYHASREAGFSRYQRSGAGWVIIETNGHRHELGLTAEGRTANPDDPSHVQSWLLERSSDTCGNTIDYIYDHHGGHAYLSEVRYAVYLIRLIYETRPDIRLSGRSGFLRRMERRCTGIELHRVDGAADLHLRTWHLDYTTNPVNAASQLASVQFRAHGAAQDGSDDVLRAPISFKYNECVLTRMQCGWMETGSPHSAPPPLTDPDVALVVMDDLPLPGILQVINGRHTYWPNMGDNLWGAPRPLKEAPPLSDLRKDGLFFIDLEANGTADLYPGMANTPLHGYYRNNGGDGWGNFVGYPRDAKGEPPWQTGRVRITDIDGDGKLDAVYSSGSALLAYESLSEKGWAEPQLVARDEAVDVDFANPLVRLADMTGDGLADIVRVRSGNIEYYPNLGHGRYGERIRMTNSPRLTGLTRNPDQLFFADVDGDGCADLIWVSGGKVSVIINQGGQTYADATVHSHLPPPIPGTMRPVGMRGEATVGLLWNSRRSAGTGYFYMQFADTAAYRLEAIDNGLGLVSRIEYGDVIAEAIHDRDTGQPWRTHFPFPLTVVKTMLEVDEITGQRTETRLSYHDGHFDAERRRFNGFTRVDQIEVGDASRPDQMTVHHFLMGQENLPDNGPEHAVLNRMLARVELYQLDGTPQAELPLRVEETDYKVRVLHSGADLPDRVFMYAERTRRIFRERSNDARIEERHFSYDPLGNVIREAFRAYGDRQGHPVVEHRVNSTFEYATDPAGNIRNALARVVRRDEMDSIFDEIRTYYDGPEFIGLALGQVQSGLKMREERLALGQTEFDLHYTGMSGGQLGYTAGQDADSNPAYLLQHERNGYTAGGVINAEMDPMGNIVRFVLDPAELTRIERHDDLGITYTDYDLRSLRPTRMTTPDGNASEMRYDAQGRLTVVAVPGDSIADPTRTYRYENDSLPTSQEVVYRVDSRNLRTVTYFDGHQEVLQKRVERDVDEIIVSGWIGRNPWGQSAIEYEPTLDSDFDFAQPEFAGRPARRVYFDAEGRPVRTLNYNGGVSTVEYSPFDIIERDANDNDDSAANQARGQTDTPRQVRLNALQRRISISEIDANGAMVTTSYTTDVMGRLTALGNDTGAVATYRYDRRGNRLAINHRDAGLRRLWYDAAGTVVRTQDGNNNDIRINYDSSGRITDLLEGNTARESFSYDDLPSGAWGRLHEVSYLGGKQVFAYNTHGQTIHQEYHYDGQAQPHVVEFEYNQLGKQTAVIYPDGARAEYTYYLNGMIRSITDFVSEIEYDARNLPTRIAYANGITSEITYAPGPGKVDSLVTRGPGGQIYQNVQYAYDMLHMLLSVSDAASGNIPQVEYEYDHLYQLTRSHGQGPTGNFDIKYKYENGRSLTDIAETATTFDYDDPTRPDRLTGLKKGAAPAFPLPYDSNGNIGALPGRQLHYDLKNQLHKVERDDGATIEYLYDHRGNRIRKRVQPAAGGGPAVETMMIGNLAEIRDGQVTRFILLGRNRVALVDAGQTRWIHTDPLGSASFFSDTNGTRIARIAYYPFGNVLHRDGNPACQTFGLHEFDSDAGLYFMGKRCYAPEIGRFVTPDPLHLYRPESSDGDTAQLALYTYVGNNPTNRTDPTGLSFWSVFGAIIGVIIGVVLAVLVIAAFMCGVGFGILAIAGVIGLLTAGYLGARAAAGTAGGEFLRGMLIGINAGMNMVLASIVFGLLLGPIGIIIGVGLGVLNFLAAFDTIANSEVYQGILGWANWLMPMSWLVIGIGLVMFVLNALGFLITFGQSDFCRIDGIRVDWSTGTIFTKGGWISNLNAWDTAFNMGNFAFVDTNSASWHMDHEAGHTLSLGAFGSLFHFIGFFDEVVFGAGSDAYAEHLADSNDPASTDPDIVPMWV
ncbi:MAG: hypothetical protein GY835_25340 [bacterium]|nr:hypothetical protein [bacterium]